MDWPYCFSIYPWTWSNPSQVRADFLPVCGLCLCAGYGVTPCNVTAPDINNNPAPGPAALETPGIGTLDADLSIPYPAWLMVSVFTFTYHLHRSEISSMWSLTKCKAQTSLQQTLRLTAILLVTQKCWGLATLHLGSQDWSYCCCTGTSLQSRARNKYLGFFRLKKA